MIRMDFSETKPVHVRIKDDIKKLILSRAVQPGDVLPSVRETSSKKAMNPEAVHRAYRELCEDGWLTETDGRYAVSSFMSVSEIRTKALLKELDEIVSELLTYHYSKAEIEERIGKLVERSTPNASDK